MLYHSTLRCTDTDQCRDSEVILEYIDDVHFVIRNQEGQYLSAHENLTDVYWTCKNFIPLSLCEVFKSVSGFISTSHGTWVRYHFIDQRYYQSNPDDYISASFHGSNVSLVSQKSSIVIDISGDDVYSVHDPDLNNAKIDTEPSNAKIDATEPNSLSRTSSGQSLGVQLEKEFEEFNSKRNVDTTNLVSPVKRSRGRPKGSTNKEKDSTEKPKKRIRTAAQIAYSEFSKKQRPRLKPKYPNLPIAEMNKKIAKRWNALSEEEQHFYFP